VHRDIKPENMMVSKLPRRETDMDSYSHSNKNKIRGQSVGVTSGNRFSLEDEDVYILKVIDLG
jgi:serine/threonine protein kinase